MVGGPVLLLATHTRSTQHAAHTHTRGSLLDLLALCYGWAIELLHGMG